MSWIQYIGSGQGWGWEAKGGLYHPPAQRQSHCVFSKEQKQPQCTCQAWTVVGSSLTPHAALMNLQGQKNAACESRPGYLIFNITSSNDLQPSTDILDDI